MTFGNVSQSSYRLIATCRVQRCTNCSAGNTEPVPILRSQLSGWRITCPLCGDLFRDASGRDISCPFHQYRRGAVRGEKLLEDEGERSVRTWASPSEIARLLLMRRIPRPVLPEEELGRFRVLGAIIPDLDHVGAEQQKNLPTPASPILPLHMRPALLAGVAIVECGGPETLRMLRGHMMGDNKVRFSDTVESMIAQARCPHAFSQMHLV
jgi:hypothetical protein